MTAAAERIEFRSAFHPSATDAAGRLVSKITASSNSPNAGPPVHANAMAAHWGAMAAKDLAKRIA
jgi:hypothetical protein